jgi:hypothetical protein
MAVIWLEPYNSPPAGLGFPAGIAGGYPVSDSTTRSTTTLYPLGTLARDAAGNEYIYVKAGATIPINSAVKANADLSDVRVTAAAGDALVGVADAAFATGDNGFLLSRGTVSVITAGAIAANTLLSPAAAGAMAAMAAADLVAKPAFVLVNSATPQKIRLG